MELLQRGFAKSITSSGRESIALIIMDLFPLEHGAWPHVRLGACFHHRVCQICVHPSHGFRQGAAESAEADVPAAIRIVLR